ncbi:hypothetical protein [Streptomyces fumanus]|uniref:Uncharacterized protein n=1 Tax=Streptomyces fumanus TaxID=67302 RepID=A0A919AZ92_9ACTN|nr:hypothetical protein [Streptomyces fumanus]GHF33731.1 hypothetical protein GCM10018772_69210 [Streptomyces fumanus]
MTAKDIGPRDVLHTVRVRTDGETDEESLAYLREKVGTALDRPGLPPVSGQVRVVRAAAHHVALPWSAGAEIRIGNHLVVVHARENTATELADRLHDRLRDSVERVAHRGDTARRSAAPPPWRGGPRR